MMRKNDEKTSSDSKNGSEITRRQFLKYSTATFAAVSLFPSLSLGSQAIIKTYPVDLDYSNFPISGVATTAQRMLSFPMNWASKPDTENLPQVSQYSKYGYGNWTFGAGLPMMQRADIMPFGYSNPTPIRNTKLMNFFTITDIHITDKEAPNQLIYFQQKNSTYAGNNTSIYSPVMMYTTHVLDAAIQTVNALHQHNAFDFGISLGDVCDSTRYNELRWYIDVIDGKVIIPSSGANVGASSIDYQTPFQAAGLDKSIPWYQVLGNHDHFYLGSFPVDADPTLGIRNSYIADTVWSVGGTLLVPDLDTFPTLINMENGKASPAYYMGLIDGSTPYGNIINAGLTTDPVFTAGAPKIVADPNRRSLLRSQWIAEFTNSTTEPKGHGFNLIETNSPYYESGFACYSFMPKGDVPLKIIVLDDTQSETDGSTDIHGHGYLDAKRWAWLQAELAAGQAADQLMIIAAHIPIGLEPIGAETEWWLGENTTTPEHENAVTLDGLVQALWDTPNLLMWIVGHLHNNTVKAFVSPDHTKPEQGFWQVETSSLRDFPQQFRTFEIYLNSDYTVSIVTTNVDPAVADGTPAATSRKYAIATQQITANNLTPNFPNLYDATVTGGSIPVPSMDPSRPQDGTTDVTIQWVNQSSSANGAPYNASYNAELFKKLSPQMEGVLRLKFPQPA